MNKNTRVLSFMNAYTFGKSGGDLAFIEIFKKLNFQNLTIVTSVLGKKLCENSGLKAEYILTSKEDRFSGVFATYFLRIVHALSIGCKYDLLYSSSDSLPDILPACVYKIFHKKTKWVVKRYHDIPKKRLVPFFFQRISMFLIAKFSDKIIQNGKFGFDHVDFDKIVKSTQKFDAVFMSRLHFSKGIFDLIEIWKNVVLQKPDATLAIIGAGGDDIVSKLKAIILECKLNKNIKLMGFLDVNQAFSIVKSTRLFLLPSHEEAFGIVIGEAMFCKTPVVAYALPELKWCRDYTFVVPCFEKEYFAKLICELLNDEKKRIKYVDKAYKYARSFTWEKAAENEKELISNLNI